LFTDYNTYIWASYLLGIACVLGFYVRARLSFFKLNKHLKNLALEANSQQSDNQT